jgi:hypothetical protein
MADLTTNIASIYDKIRMAKSAISVTLQDDNLTWLRGRVRADQARSVSAVLDRIVAEARTRGTGSSVRSVVGTIEVAPADPLLARADEAIHALLTNSLSRPFLAKEDRSTYNRAPRQRTRRG